MRIRNFPFCAMGALFLLSLIIFPVAVSAGETEPNSLTKQVMSGSNTSSMSPLKNKVQVTKTEKKKGELQINLGDELKAYISAGESPYGKDLNGKPLRGSYRTTFGFHIPL
jgi:hypothetical protein